jgi:hypothetical protein
MLAALSIGIALLAAPQLPADGGTPPPTPPADPAPATVVVAAPSGATAALSISLAGARREAVVAPATIPATLPAALAPLPSVAADTPVTRPRAFEYSDGYGTRATIHRWASYAIVPVFVAQYVVGEKLIDDRERRRDGVSASDDEGGHSKWSGPHSALAGGVAGLVAVNTVTGVWNLWEARKDPNGRTRRTLHAVTMLLADAGFVATAALAEDEGDGAGAHRTVAISSMGLATLSTAMMWLWKE